MSQKFHPNNKNFWKYQCGNFRTKNLVCWYFTKTLNLSNLKQKTIKWICLENRYYDLSIDTSLSQTYIVQKGWKVSSQRYALISFWCFLCKNLSQFTKKNCSKKLVLLLTRTDYLHLGKMESQDHFRIVRYCLCKNDKNKFLDHPTSNFNNFLYTTTNCIKLVLQIVYYISFLKKPRMCKMEFDKAYNQVCKVDT